MLTFEKEEIWDDNWCFKPNGNFDLTNLEILNYTTLLHSNRNRIEIHIETDKKSIEPTKNQIDIFNYILQNQTVIKQSIYEYYKNVVLPIYKVAIDIDAKDIVQNEDELKKVFGLNRIEIPEFNYDKKYYLFNFDFRYEDEHGLYFLFEDDKIIDLFGEGDKNFDSVELYQKGMNDLNGKPINYSICDLKGLILYQGNVHFDEVISQKLNKGTYRAYTICNSTSRTRNFFVTKNLENFTLEKVLTMKE